MRTFSMRSVAGFMLLGMLVPVLAACGGAPATVPIKETVTPAASAAPTVPAAQGEFTTPHPILSDLKVRQAIAYCTNRPELISSVYPFLSADEQKGLLMDTFLPQGHWALAKDGITTYPFDAKKGAALLEEAGWKLPKDDTVRANAKNEPLSLSFTTTNVQFRQTWSAIFIQQMAACGIQIIPTYAPASWWFGATTGLARRDYELGGYAWVGQTDPGGITLYACNQIPLPSNNWQGQNSMGWCNQTASKAVNAANNTLDRNERIKQYGITQVEFSKDMVSLPLFNRFEAAAASNRFQGFKSDPTEYYTANADEWTVKDGDTLVLGFSQEPASLWTTVEQAASTATAIRLISSQYATQYGYDYQPVAQKTLATIESGAAKNVEVDVKEGDTVWTTAGEPAKLAKDVEVTTADGTTTKFSSGTLKLKQLTVTYTFIDGLKWADGKPFTKDDFALAYKIDCDPASGAVSLTGCKSISKVDFTSDTSYTVTYVPGVQWSTYYLAPIGSYPAHQVITSEGTYKGKTLAEVPAKDWSTLPEIAETPLSSGPYILEKWEKGQSMTFTANPNYYKGEPKVKKIIIKFIADANQAVAQLLTGDVDALDSSTLGAGDALQTVLDAAKKGTIQAFPIASSTWEHIDFNLFVK